MYKKRVKHILFILLFLGLILGVDRYTKNLVRTKMEYFDRIHYFYDHFFIERVENHGAFLSLGDSLSGISRTIILNLIPFLVLFFGLGYLLIKLNHEKQNLYGIIFVVGGGFGNLYDRIVFGGVTDFMQIKFGFLQTGIFNVADMSIMAGIFLILIHSFLKKKENNIENHSSTDVVNG